MNIPSGYMTGISRRSRFRAMAGPVPNHAVVPTIQGDRLLCTGAPAEAFTNGGGRDCLKCVQILKEQELDEGFGS